MTSLTQDIKNKLNNLNILEKVIAINVIIFLFANIFGLLYATKTGLSLGWFELPSTFSQLLYKPWAILTYAFVHYSVMHILFNMFLLYIIAQWFVNLFSMKLALNVYLLGAIAGGVFFVSVYTIFPNTFGYSKLIGASAAVRALLIFLCAYMPNKDIRFFTINIKLWHLGAVIIAIDVLGVLGGIKAPLTGNAGGNIAHLGGATLGYFYAKQLVKGKDIGASIEPLITSFLQMFKKQTKKGYLRTVHKNKGKIGGYAKADFDTFNNQKQIDVILDKISKSGYESLTSQEKEFLFRAGK